MAKRAELPPSRPSSAPGAEAEIKREVQKSSAFVSVYANDVQVQTTPWDLRFVFGEVSGPVSPENMAFNVIQLAEVRVSPQLAKRLMLIMAQQIQGYEERIGQIPQPKEGES